MIPTPQASMFTRRLERLLRMADDYRRDLNESGRKLFERAIWATYQDCADTGAGDEADRLLRVMGYKPEGDE